VIYNTFMETGFALCDYGYMELCQGLVFGCIACNQALTSLSGSSQSEKFSIASFDTEVY
jgi:hypothetical protein